MLVVSGQAAHRGAIKGTSAGLPILYRPAVVLRALDGSVHLRGIFPTQKRTTNAKHLPTPTPCFRCHCSVHEHNQEALMGAALVYHETHQFVRLVQIMPLERSTWAFLVPMQRSGAPLPRATLVQRCLNDQVRRESCLCRKGWRAVPAVGSSSYFLNPKAACRASDRASNCLYATAAPLPAPHTGQNKSESNACSACSLCAGGAALCGGEREARGGERRRRAAAGGLFCSADGGGSAGHPEAPGRGHGGERLAAWCPSAHF